MKLKIINTPKTSQGHVFFGKNGQLRLRSELAKQLSLKKGERWLFGTDEDDKKNKFLYVLPSIDDNQNGFKLMHSNSTWFFCCKTIANELNIETPKKYRYFICEIDNLKGFKIEIN